MRQFMKLEIAYTSRDHYLSLTLKREPQNSTRKPSQTPKDIEWFIATIDIIQFIN